MIDNFGLIKPLFYFNHANNMFFHCQIVQRAKDHPEVKVRERAIKTYFIRSKEHLEELKEEIVILCEHYGARAYINVAGKDFGEVNELMLVKLATYNYEDNLWEINPRKILNSAAGEVKSRKPKWVIDIDNPTTKDVVHRWLRAKSLYTFEIVEIPTVQGYHLITPKFNLQEFKSMFPDIDVHKNSMGTLLYYPKSLEKQHESN